MRILAINQVYLPDPAATSQLLGELCEDLVEAGHEVTVLASRGDSFGGALHPPREEIRGVRVVRLPSLGVGKRYTAARAAEYLLFWASAVARLASVERPDVMLALTTPPLIAAAAAAVSVTRRVPLVTWNHDVYPNVAVELGVLERDGLPARALTAVQRATLRAARANVALSEGMALRLRDLGAPPASLAVIPNWADGGALRPVAHEVNAFRARLDVGDAFVAMYSGNIGLAHDVDTFTAAARRLADRKSPVLLVFLGEGGRLEEVRRGTRGLGNVRFVPRQPRSSLAESLSAGDAHLVSLRAGLGGLVVPSKLYGVMACGRPVIFVGPRDCEVARVVREEEIGWATTPGDAEGLADALSRAAASRTSCASWGARAREVFLRRYDRPLATRRHRELLERFARAPTGRPAPPLGWRPTSPGL